MSEQERTHWLDSLSWQADFHHRAGRARRKDPEFEWKAYESSPSGRLPRVRLAAKHLLFRMGMRPDPPVSVPWLRTNAEPLWETRSLLADDLSRLLFDSVLVLRMTGHRNFYFPRIDFDDLLQVISDEPFAESGFPRDYLGVPLRVFQARLDRPTAEPFKVITRAIQLRLINSYRQYLVRRGGLDVSPRTGEIVYDCGACIGEVSLLFAAMVAPAGEVHLFDPMPLHARFCELQASLNPAIAHTLHVNTLAVGDQTHAARAPLAAQGRIIPGAISTADFACTRLDDYAASHRHKVDFIKMDIEGQEREAIDGAAGIISEMRPRLAISGYHKPEDLWVLPMRIRELNPNYRIFFGHHTPVSWESVFYAVDADGGPGQAPA
ncbi:FkbM family methyltransferase [Frateuria sp. GZRR35]|uniref:FkbM family methyltransferase n=1 Tax=unclassified Frateuria TaxID=2648894 RepID=UPI003EDBBF6C